MHCACIVHDHCIHCVLITVKLRWARILKKYLRLLVFSYPFQVEFHAASKAVEKELVVVSALAYKQVNIGYCPGLHEGAGRCVSTSL